MDGSFCRLFLSHTICNAKFRSGACVACRLSSQEIWDLASRWSIHNRIGYFILKYLEVGYVRRRCTCNVAQFECVRWSHKKARRQVATRTRERSINVARRTVKQYDVASIIDGNPSSLFRDLSKGSSSPKTRFKRRAVAKYNHSIPIPNTITLPSLSWK